jgi:acyl-CoA dehydrogenase
MEFEFSPDAVMLCEMLSRFVQDEAKPLEMKYFTTGTLEDKERARLRKVIDQMGLWGITVPEKFGGGGLDTLTTCLLEQELGKTFIPLDIGDIPPLLYACQGQQVQAFLEPALSGARRPFLAVREPNALLPETWKTTAELVDGGYILNGEKILSAMPTKEDFLVIFAGTARGPGAFLLDMKHPGIQLSINGRVLLQLTGCRSGPEALLGELGQAFSLGEDEVPRASIRLGARYVGLAQRLLSMAAEYARDWQSLGGLLKDRPAVQKMLADLQVQVECTRWFVYHAAWMADRQEPLRSAAAQVRLATGEMLKKATDLVTLIFGGVGPSPQVEMHRFVSAAIPMEAFEAGMDAARFVVAAEILAKGKEGAS